MRHAESNSLRKKSGVELLKEGEGLGQSRKLENTPSTLPEPSCSRQQKFKANANTFAMGHSLLTALLSQGSPDGTFALHRSLAGLQARLVMDGSPCRLRLSSGGGGMTILEHGLKDILLYCISLSNRAQL